MITTALLIIILLSAVSVPAQTEIKGKITGTNGKPLAGANVFIKGTYDGTASAEDGKYSFKTTAKGKAMLVASFLGYANQEKEISIVEKTIEVNFILNEKITRLNDVVITAGTFETADRRRSVTLQPLDIVTTPSAAGDIYGALTTIPGTATIGEDGRLFVRGGDGYETKTFIDGLLAKKPYSSSVPDLPSRGRFSPFLFTGTTFSTGGYSAEYGQALSSALILTTNAFPQKTQIDISLMSVGGSVSQTFRGENASFSIGLDYMNMEPYHQLIPSRFKMNRYPESIGSTLTFRKKLTNNGLIKAFSTFNRTRFGIVYPNMLSHGAMANITLQNQNSYTNVTYSGDLGNGWFLRSGVAFTLDQNNLNLETASVSEGIRNVQAKVTFKKTFNPNTSILFGVEETFNRFHQDYRETATLFTNTTGFDDFTTALYAEAEFRPVNGLALRLGTRGEHSSLLKDNNIAARISAAIKLTQSAQISLAYGNFYQTPEEELLRFTKSLRFEQADHYIVNYQWERNDRLLRVEAYRKEYKDLVTFNPVEFWNGAFYSNSGIGHSQGIDVFFRDRKTFRFFEYWVSYSFVDSKRKYRDYPEMVTPPFAPAHSASFVGKKWVQEITTQFGFSATFASGRPFNNPNSTKFMDGRTPYYSDISINCSHLRSIFGIDAIFYLSVSNLLGRDNIFGYRYYAHHNAEGKYESIPVKPSSKRFYFAGIFITI